MQALEMSLQLDRRGHRIWLACLPNGRLHREAVSRKLRALPLPVSGYVHPGVLVRLRRFFIEERPDIVHCQLSKDIATVVPAMRLALKRTPILLSKRVGSFIEKKDPFHRFTYAYISRVLAISSVIRNNVIATTPVPAERVLTFYDAVDTTAFSLSAVDRAKARSEFGYDDGMTVVGFAGRFSPGKGHEELLSAAAIIRRERQNVRFLVAGEASFGEEHYERHIRGMAHDLGLDHVVTFAGFRRDVPAVMSAFDLLAFPSHAESFGLVLIEAMAMERAVVSTNCDGVLDIVVDGVTGLYVPPRNAGELAKALLQLIGDEGLRTSMGKAGRRRVLELFDQSRQIERLEKIYHEVLRESGMAPRPAQSQPPPAASTASSSVHPPES